MRLMKGMVIYWAQFLFVWVLSSLFFVNIAVEGQYSIKTYDIPNSKSESVTIDNEENIWSVFGANKKVVRMFLNGTVIRQYIADDWPIEIQIDETIGQVWISTYTGISAYNISTGALLSFVSLQSKYIRMDASGSLWAFEFFGRDMNIVNSSGVITDTFDLHGYIQDIAFDSSQNGWVLCATESPASANLFKVTDQTWDVTEITLNAFQADSISSATNLAIDLNDNIWIVSYITGDLLKFDNNGVFVGFFHTKSDVRRVIVDKDNFVWIGSDRGTVTKYANNIAGEKLFERAIPPGLTNVKINGNGILWVFSANQGLVTRVCSVNVCPTPAPTQKPTLSPTSPTKSPTNSPTNPTKSPTSPTNVPSKSPTKKPTTRVPSKSPSVPLTQEPSIKPTTKPTTQSPTSGSDSGSFRGIIHIFGCISTFISFILISLF